MNWPARPNRRPICTTPFLETAAGIARDWHEGLGLGAEALDQGRAAAVLERSWPMDWLDPAEGLRRLERARVADGLGEPDKAVQEYRVLADLWRTADPELRPEVEEANAALKRLAGGLQR